MPPNNEQSIHQAIRSVLPDYVEAVHDLPDRRDHYRGSHWLSEDEWDEAKEHTIAYNDVFREIIENNPHLQPEAIVSIALTVTDELGYADDVKEMIRHNTFGVLRGMQHEIAFEHVLKQLPEDYTILYTDDEDDAHGADFKVRCPNGVVISIDVKATERLAEEARKRTSYYMKKHHRKPRADEIVLFSGFEEYDFDEQSPWIPKQEVIDRAVPYVESALKSAADRTAARLAKHGR